MTDSPRRPPLPTRAGTLKLKTRNADTPAPSASSTKPDTPPAWRKRGKASMPTGTPAEPRRRDGDERPSRGADDRPQRPFGDRPPRRDDDAPRGFGPKPGRGFGDKPARGGFNDRPRRDGDERPSRGADDRPQRPFGDRPPRRDDDAPRGFGPKPGRGFGDKPARGGFNDRPRRDGDERPSRGADDRPQRPFGDLPPRRNDDAPSGFGPKPGRGFGDKPARGGFNDRPRRDGDERTSRGADDRPQRPFGDRPPRRDDDAPRGFGPKPGRGFGDKPARGGFNDRPRRDGDERPSRGSDDRPQRAFGDRPPRRDDAPAAAKPPRHERKAWTGEPLSEPTPSPLRDDGSVRLSKRMTDLGLCSRREADEYIEKGWVRVDGRVVSELGARVMPDQSVELDRRGQTAQDRRVTILLNKPVGYVSGQAEDGYQPASVLITADNRWEEDPSETRFLRTHHRGLAPAGRLDIDSHGLLVFTQDGRIARALIGDDSSIEKEYHVRVEGALSQAGLEMLNHGLSLDGQALRPAKVSWLNEDQLRFVLREGKKRQIRRMCELVGLKVVGLKRVRIGQVMLGKLPVGQWRYLGTDEVF